MNKEEMMASINELLRRRSRECVDGGEDLVKDALLETKLLAMKIELEGMPMEGVDRVDGFRYYTSRQIKEAMRGLQVKYNLSFTVTIEKADTHFLEDRGRPLCHAQVSVLIHIYDVETGHSKEMPWYAGVSCDRHQAMEKAATMALKTFILTNLQISGTLEEMEPEEVPEQTESNEETVSKVQLSKLRGQISGPAFKSLEPASVKAVLNEHLGYGLVKLKGRMESENMTHREALKAIHVCDYLLGKIDKEQLAKYLGVSGG